MGHICGLRDWSAWLLLDVPGNDWGIIGNSIQSRKRHMEKHNHFFH